MRSFPVKLTFFFFILLLAVFSLFVLLRIDKLSKSADRVNKTNEVHLKLEETISWLREVESCQRGFLLTGDSLYLHARARAFANVQSTLKILHDGLADDIIRQQHADTLEMLIDKRADLLNRVLLLQNHDPQLQPGVRNEILNGRYAMNAVQAYADKMMQHQDSKQRDYLSDFKTYTFFAPLSAFALIIFVFAFFIIAYSGLRRQLHISKQLAIETETANKKLTEANTIFEMAEETGGMGSWTFNLDTRQIEWSKNLCHLYGLDATNYHPSLEKHLAMIHPLDREKMLLARKDAFEHSLPIIQEFRIIRNDGVLRYLRIFSKLVINGDGERVLMGTTQDVTGITHVTQKLKDTNTLYENAEAIASIGSWQLDLNTKIFKCSNNLFHIYGSEPRNSEVSLENFLLFVHPKDKEKVMTQLSVVAYTGKLEKVSFRIIRKDGVLRYMEATGKLVKANSDDPIILGTTQDITEITKAVESLKESEAFNRKIMELAPNAIYVFDLATGTTLFSNKNIKTLHGYSQEEINQMGAGIAHMIHPDEVAHLAAVRMRYPFLEDEEVIELQYKLKHKNGEWQHIYAHNRAFKRNANGEVIQIVGVATNVTEVKRATEVLVKTNASFENAEIAAGIGSWLWNQDTNEFSASKNLFRIYGFEPYEFEPGISAFLDHVHPDDREKANIRVSADSFEHNKVITVNYRIIDKKGRLIQVQGKRKYFRNEKGEKVVLGTIQDISVLVRVINRLGLAIDRLKKSEAYNRSITELAPNAIYIYDIPSGTTAFLNKGLLDVHGYSDKDIIDMGNSWWEKIVHPEDRAVILHKLQVFAASNNNGIHKQEFRILNKKGEWRYHFAREVIFKRNENGEAEQIMGVATDVSDMKKAAQKLDQLNRDLTEKNIDLQQANEELASFNFIASHDLQEPLRKIQTFISFIIEKENSISDTSKDYLRRMQHAALRMRNLINDLLSYSRSSMVDDLLQPVDLNVILKNTRSMLKTSIDEKQAVIHADILPVVQGVDFQMQQLFENLVGNAIKYSKPGEQPVVTITTEEVRYTQSAQGLKETHWYHKISFTDNGIGFDQEYAGRIFELFQRLHTKNEYEGTGIGLAICKKIVHTHGGHIEAQSTPGAGAIFSVYLPVVNMKTLC